MANVRKFNNLGSIGHMLRHNARSAFYVNYSNKNIKSEKTKENYNLAPERGDTFKYMQDTISKYCKTDAAGKSLRKDAVRMVSWIVDAPEFLPKEKEKEFFKEVYSFLVNRYGSNSIGEKCVLSAYVHKDEKTPHVHFSFIPLDAKLKLRAKAVIDRNDLKTFHTDLENHLVSKGLCVKGDIKNGNTMYHPDGRAYSMAEYKKAMSYKHQYEVKR